MFSWSNLLDTAKIGKFISIKSEAWLCRKESKRLDSFRHVHASLLLNNNIDLKTISTHLGHSSIKITADTYIKTFAENHTKLAYDLYDFFNQI